MPLQLPPGECRREAVVNVLPAGTLLWRVHPKKYKVEDFNPTPADRKIGGGRFDCTSVRFYPYLYAAVERTTALMETIVRSLLADPATGRRTVVRARIKKLALARIELTRDLSLLHLEDRRHLAAICSDEWLVQTEAENYDITRRWAMWLHGRDWHGRGAPQGLLWQAKRDQPRQAVMLFGDRCAGAVRAVPGSEQELDDPLFHPELSAMLHGYGVTLNPPHSPKPPGA